MTSNDVSSESPLELFLWAIGEGGQIGKCDDYPEILMNGRERYEVHVIFKDNSERTIKAFDQDAVELCKNVMRMKRAHVSKA